MSEYKKYLDDAGTEHLINKIKLKNYEQKINKDTVIDSSASADKYPSTLAVKNYVDDHIPSLENYASITYVDEQDNILDEKITTNINAITDLSNNKQDKLTAGENITIDENNVISASGGGSSKPVEITFEYGSYPASDRNDVDTNYDQGEATLTDSELTELRRDDAIIKTINNSIDPENAQCHASDHSSYIYLKKIDEPHGSAVSTNGQLVFTASGEYYNWIVIVFLESKKAYIYRYKIKLNSSRLVITTHGLEQTVDLNQDDKEIIDTVPNIKRTVDAAIIQDPNDLDPNEKYELVVSVVKKEGVRDSLKYEYKAKSWDGMRVEDHSFDTVDKVIAIYGGPAEDWHLLSDDYDVYQWLRDSKYSEE